MTISLSGKKILVTGATGAVGRAVAERLRECGAAVYGSYLASEGPAAEMGRKGIAMRRADLSRREEAKGLVAWALQQAGQLDGLVYTAGNTRDRTFLKMTEEEWDCVLRLHLDGLMACCREALPAMRGKSAGKLVALGSISGTIGRGAQANYSAAKAATVGFIKSIAREVGRHGVSANVVFPGFVDSRMTRSAPPEAWERAKADSAMGRISDAQVAASFIAWLLSDLCRGVTGQVFNLDSRIY
ncbi:MAG: SDR family oxidoreductase [Candidatus Omnitrophica bacterium]|nr:SDR family oxidoreductase [Candidatus Omnitrophota bacterium]